MKKQFAILLASAAVVSSIGATAEALSDAEQIAGAAPTDVTQSAPPASTTLRVPGTIAKYDASTRMLSLSTSNGTLRFTVSSNARVRQGGQTVDASELVKLSGYRAAVRYSESGGNKTVESIHVFGK